mmetsp:Transcript_6171/g.8884  ORF Transcript_6171/g.8884 Transcript_6171/m.8884 type:complete len:295 (-) Transcript_6171:1672-2556(-)
MDPSFFVTLLALSVVSEIVAVASSPLLFTSVTLPLLLESSSSSVSLQALLGRQESSLLSEIGHVFQASSCLPRAMSPWLVSSSVALAFSLLSCLSELGVTPTSPSQPASVALCPWFVLLFPFASMQISVSPLEISALSLCSTPRAMSTSSSHLSLQLFVTTLEPFSRSLFSSPGVMSRTSSPSVRLALSRPVVSHSFLQQSVSPLDASSLDPASLFWNPCFRSTTVSPCTPTATPLRCVVLSPSASMEVSVNKLESSSLSFSAKLLMTTPSVSTWVVPLSLLARPFSPSWQMKP